jgi:hypothetical protein
MKTTIEQRAQLATLHAQATSGEWGTTRYDGGLNFHGSVKAYCGTDEYHGEPRRVPETDDDPRRMKC